MPLWTAEVKAFGVVVRIEQVSTALPLRSFQQSHTPADWDRIAREIKSARWLVWHRKGRKAIPRMKAINEELEKWPNQERSALWWSVCRAYAYVESNVGLLVNYGARYRKSLPIASSIAESAVNQVVSVRMAKKQQMRDGPTRERTSWRR